MNKIMGIFRHTLFKGAAIMFIGTTIVNFGNYIYHLIMGRVLGPVNYGTLESVISSLYLLGIVTLALGITITKFVSDYKGRNKTEDITAFYNWIKSRALVLGTAFTLILLLVAPYWAAFLKISDTKLIYLAILILLLSVFSVIVRSFLCGLLKFGWYNISNIVEVAAKIALGLILVLAGYSTFGAITGILFAGVAGVAVVFPFLKLEKITGGVRFMRQKDFYAYFLVALGSTIGLTSLYSTDVILVKHYFTAHDAGIYASISVLGKIVFFISSSFVSVMFPVISQRSAKGEKYHKILWLTFSAVLIMSLAITLVYLLFPYHMINILFGSRFLSGQDLLGLFGIFITLYSLSNVLINYYLSIGRKKIVVLPLLAGIVQIILIAGNHSDLTSVIINSIISVTVMFMFILFYMFYDKSKR